MSIKKFFIKADASIYNAFQPNMKFRGTEANTGLADSLEVFFLFGQDVRNEAVLSDKLEEARIIIYPNLSQILDYYGGEAAPANTKFILKLFNAEHPFTLPRGFTLDVHAISDTWEEGTGLDMESYTDSGAVSWNKSDPQTNWNTPGALAADSQAIASATFSDGTENMEIDLTTWLTNNWNQPTTANTSFVITLPTSITDGSQESNFYTKKFFSRTSEFFFKRPVIEARSSDAIFDNRANFVAKNKVLPSSTQKFYIYNSVKGERTDFNKPDGESLYVRLYKDSDRTELATLDPDATHVEGEKHSKGVYFAEVTLDESGLSKVYDQWYYAPNGDSNAELRTVVYEGEIKVGTHSASGDTGHNDYFVSETNIKSSYSATERAKFRFYTRLKDWSPTIYTVASKNIEANIVEKTYYKIIRLVDDEVVVDYGIGNDQMNKEHTRLSYDELGSYFDFDISMLEPGYMYGIKLMFSLNGEELEQPETFKFRVD